MAKTGPMLRRCSRLDLPGPVELRRDGERIALPGGKTTELLVRLALEAGRTVHPERLIDDLWWRDGIGTAIEHVAVQGLATSKGSRRL